MSVAVLHEVLRWINVAAMCAVLAQICSTGLQRFRWFFFYLFFNLSLQAIGIYSGWQSALYCAVFLWSRPVFMTTRALATWEIFGSLFRRFTGLRILAHGALTSALILSLISASAAIPASRRMWACPDYQCYFFILAEAERFLSLSLAVFTLLMIMALQRLHADISRTTVAHSIIWSLRLIAALVIGVVFLHSRDTGFHQLCNIAMHISGISCNVSWLFLVGRAPHESPNAIPDVDAATSKLCDDLIAFRGVLEETRIRLSRSYLPRFFPRA